MTILRSGMVLCLFALFCVTVVSASGNGTFSITSSKGVDTGDTVTATVFLENNWDPLASDVYMHVLFDSSMLEYVSTDFKIGHTVAATKDTDDSIFLQFGDFTNGYPNGKFPIADLKFRAVRAGTSPLKVVVDHVRYYAPVDIGDSASVESGTVIIGSGISSTGIPEGTPTTVPSVTTQSTTTSTTTTTTTSTTAVPSVTSTNTSPAATPTITPTTAVSTVTPTITTPTVTSTISVPTIMPTQPMIVVTLSISPSDYASSDDYTGVVTGQTTTTSTTSATSSPATPTEPSSLGTAGPTQTPSITVSPTSTMQTISTLTSAITTTIRTLVPLNATTTQAAAPDIGLLFLSLGGIGALFIAKRLR